MSSSRCKLAISRANLLWAINLSVLVLSRLLLFIKVANNIIKEWHHPHFLLEMNGGCWPWWRRLPLSSIIRRNIFLSCSCWERFVVCLHLNSEFWLFSAIISTGRLVHEKRRFLQMIGSARETTQNSALNDWSTTFPAAKKLDSLSSGSTWEST